MDYYYLLLVLPAFIISLVAQAMVRGSYRRMSRIQNSRHITGAAAANAVLRQYGVTGVAIEECGGNLTDHYDPRTNVIRLSQGVYSSDSIAAVGIACHEAGHAAQHAEGYSPIRIRNSLLPVCRIGSFAGIPLALIGYYLSIEPLILVGLLLYSVIIVFQLATLPVEFNASARALQVIDDTGLLGGEERKKAATVLRCAAFTYVASLAVTIANLLRFVLLFLGGRRRR